MIYYVSNRILSCPYSLIRVSLSVAKQHIVISIWQTSVPPFCRQKDKRRFASRWTYVTVSSYTSSLKPLEWSWTAAHAPLIMAHLSLPHQDICQLILI